MENVRSSLELRLDSEQESLSKGSEGPGGWMRAGGGQQNINFCLTTELKVNRLRLRGLVQELVFSLCSAPNRLAQAITLNMHCVYLSFAFILFVRP